MTPIRPFSLEEDEVAGEFRLAPSSGAGAKLLRGLVGATLPLAILIHSLWFTETGLTWMNSFAAITFWGLYYVFFERYELRLRLAENKLHVGLRPFFLTLISASFVSLEDVSDVRPRRGGVELLRGGRWRRLWIAYPPFPTAAGERANERIVRFLSRNMSESAPRHS